MDTFESSSQYIASTQSYDALGRVSQTTNPSRPGDGLNFAATYSYDMLSRTINVLTADGANTSTSFSGNTATATDPAGVKRTNTSDALGRLTLVQENPGGLNYTTGYTYDALGNLTRVAQGSQIRGFTYDGLSRLIQAVNPESGTVSYTYDNAGNPLTRTDNRGIETVYGNYDGLNRLSAVSYSDGTANVSYTYDAANIANSKGQLTSVANENSTTNYTAFDAMGNVLASNQATGGPVFSFSYAYNLAGSLIGETYPSGRIVSTSYDGANRPYSLGGSRSGVQTNYVQATGYVPSGAPSYYAYGNNLWRQNSYNSRLQLSGYVDLINNNTNSELLNVSLNWGSNTNSGSLQSAVYNHGGPGYQQFLTFNQTFGYDAVNRLISASDSGGWSRTFGYDTYGNMWVTGNSGVGQAGNTPVPGAFNGNNQISSASYDAAGNQTSVNGNTAVYDAENRLVEVIEAPAFGSGTEVLAYDGLGQRVQKATPSGGTVYVYDAFGQLAAEYSDQQNTWACTTCYLSYDHLGSVRLVTDQNANVIARHDYLPFGEEIPAGSANRNAQFGVTDYVNPKFTGQMRDQETGLDFFNARYFGAALGRFTSPDPANIGADPSDPQTWNAYSYVRNNPLNATDPSGMLVDTNPDDPCAYVGDFDASCSGLWGLWPDGDPLYPGSGSGGSSGGGGRGGGASSPPPTLPGTVPFPPDSFPGGENSGLPPGMSLPGPFGLTPNCGFGTCVGGVPGASGILDPATIGAGAGGGSIIIDIGLGTLCVGTGVCEAIAIGAGVVAVGAGAYIIYKKVSKRSGKEMASDAPSWASNYPKGPGESCAVFAARILVEKYGAGTDRALRRGPVSEYSQIKKACERGGI